MKRFRLFLYFYLHLVHLVKSFRPHTAPAQSKLLLSARKTGGGGGISVQELSERIAANPSRYEANNDQLKKNGTRRRRQRVTNPKQKYVYAAQRRKNTAENKNNTSDDDVDADRMEVSSSIDPVKQAKEFGLIAATQHVDPLIEDTPVIRGQLRVSSDSGSGAFAYLIEKPLGWSILGGGNTAPVASGKKVASNKESVAAKPKKTGRKQVKIVEDDGSIDILEYDEADILALLTTEELENMEEDQGDFEKSIVGQENENALLEHSDTTSQIEEAESTSHTGAAIAEQQASNLKKIAARSQNSGRGTFADYSRPSLIGWLKDTKAAEGTPIRGGNFWTAAAGATGVDDSGLVLLVPKAHVDSLFCDYIEYTAVIGNGGQVAKARKPKQTTVDNTRIDIVSKVRKGRGDDPIQAVRVMIQDEISECSTLLGTCQSQFQDGIRGDPNGNPLDRRARRRLIHCSAMSVSSLTFDETCEIECEDLPDDISILANRKQRIGREFVDGSFLGRESLRTSTVTNAYREINGAADGYPGWTVDRYDKWLLVQHDVNEPRGPLPSIHDGNTAGVYYLESSADRSAMGSSAETRPRLLEGQAAPDMFEIFENGVKYMVSLDKDLSTGIFLDQRPQRAWLSQNCCSETSVLNCFAHTGAFSVAAASAGASTVSVDLSRKWLERLPEHFMANGLEFDENHDAIFGDCFDWLARLSKRGEKFDIVIVDPPSSSVGGRKKKRWSLKNDMDELVFLASGLVKPGGLLWTSSNSATIHPARFARLCKKGLDKAGLADSRLERIQPMPSDFQTIGSQPVKNLVWRIP